MPGIILNDQKVRKVILNNRTYFGGSSSSDPNEADIFNHGEIQGWNPNYLAWQRTNGGAPIFNFNDNTTQDYLIRSGGTGWSNNTSLAVMNPIKSSRYSKFCVDLEVPEGRNGQYHHLDIGAAHPDDLFTTNSARIIFSPNPVYTGDNADIIPWTTCVTRQTLMYYSTRYNVLGNDPWYQMPRHIFRVNMPNSTDDYEYNIVIYTGFNTCKIYSIWLEP